MINRLISLKVDELGSEEEMEAIETIDQTVLQTAPIIGTSLFIFPISIIYEACYANFHVNRIALNELGIDEKNQNSFSDWLISNLNIYNNSS